jgi:hypothetical protein
MPDPAGTSVQADIFNAAVGSLWGHSPVCLEHQFDMLQRLVAETRGRSYLYAFTLRQCRDVDVEEHKVTMVGHDAPALLI